MSLLDSTQDCTPQNGSSASQESAWLHIPSCNESIRRPHTGTTLPSDNSSSFRHQTHNEGINYSEQGSPLLLAVFLWFFQPNFRPPVEEGLSAHLLSVCLKTSQTPQKAWCRMGDLNSRPTDYKSVYFKMRLVLGSSLKPYLEPFFEEFCSSKLLENASHSLSLAPHMLPFFLAGPYEGW